MYYSNRKPAYSAAKQYSVYEQGSGFYVISSKSSKSACKGTCTSMNICTCS